METRKIKITLATAERWFNGNDAELKELALTTFPELGKKSLPKSWEELGEIVGYYVSVFDEAIESSAETKGNKILSKQLFATHEQAEASIALAQLSQLMKVYNDGWVADWEDSSFSKYCIEFHNDVINKDSYYNTSNFLSFKDAETRDLFLENFRELILTAKPLL